MAAEEIAITIEITCTQLPGADPSSLHLGIQRDESITEATSVDARTIVFRPTLRAARNADGSVNFLGSFAQGPKQERFVYLNWVTRTSEGGMAMTGRIKLHLNHLKWTAVQRAAAANRPIRVTLPLTNAKGKTVMASVRPDVARWELP